MLTTDLPPHCQCWVFDQRRINALPAHQIAPFVYIVLTHLPPQTRVVYHHFGFADISALVCT